MHAQSMQLNAGRMAQEDSRRKNRHGAFWEDRYHATAIQADDHLHRCVVYIDLDMVRAGVVKHPREWEHSGYREIHKPPSRYPVRLLPIAGLYRIIRFLKIRSSRADALAKQESSDLLSSTYPT
jgi:hypothetical protein